MIARTIAALIARDVRLFFKDARAVAITLAVPIALASIIGAVFGGTRQGEATRIAIHLVDEDGSDTSRAIAAGLAKDTAVTITPSSAAAAREAVRRGQVPIAIVLPSGFGEAAGSAFFGAGEKPELELLRDPSRSAEAAMVRGILTQRVMEAVSAQLFSPGTARGRADAALRSLEVAEMEPAQKDALRRILEGARDYYGGDDTVGAGGADAGTRAQPGTRGGLTVPFVLKDEAVTAGRGLAYDGYAHAFGGMAVQFVLFMALEGGVALLEERRRGLWDRLRSAPLSRTTLLLSRLASGALLALLVVTVVFVFGALVFGVRIRGSVAGFAAVVVATAFMASAFGLVVATLGRTPEATRGLAVFAALVMTMLGGAWFPAFLFPAWMGRVTLVLPTRWAMDGLDAMTWRGLDVSAALLPTAVLLGFAVVLAAVAATRFRWE